MTANPYRSLSSALDHAPVFLSPSAPVFGSDFAFFEGEASTSSAAFDRLRGLVDRPFDSCLTAGAAAESSMARSLLVCVQRGSGQAYNLVAGMRRDTRGRKFGGNANVLYLSMGLGDLNMYDDLGRFLLVRLLVAPDRDQRRISLHLDPFVRL